MVPSWKKVFGLLYCPIDLGLDIWTLGLTISISAKYLYKMNTEGELDLEDPFSKRIKKLSHLFSKGKNNNSRISNTY